MGDVLTEHASRNAALSPQILGSVLALMLMLVVAGTVCAGAAEPALPTVAAFAHGPQQPTCVPVLPGLFVGKQIFNAPLVGQPAEGQGYQPVDGDSFARHNGPGVHNFILTSGMWWLRVGDRPRLAIELRTGSGAYAQLQPNEQYPSRVTLTLPAPQLAEKLYLWTANQ